MSTQDEEPSYVAWAKSLDQHNHIDDIVEILNWDNPALVGELSWFQRRTLLSIRGARRLLDGITLVISRTDRLLAEREIRFYQDPTS